MSFINNLKNYLSEGFGSVFDHTKIEDPVNRLRAFVNEMPEKITDDTSAISQFFRPETFRQAREQFEETTVGKAVRFAVPDISKIPTREEFEAGATADATDIGLEAATFVSPLATTAKSTAKIAKPLLKKVAPKAFKGFKNLTLKTFEFLKDKSKVSKQFISDLTNRPELKQAERDLIRDTLTDFGDDIPVQEFANKVETQLLPLDSTTSAQRIELSEISGFEGRGVPRHENIALPNELRGPIANYDEHLYQSPIKNSAGGIHFEVSDAPNYFAHTRIEDLPLPKDMIGMEGANLKTIDPSVRAELAQAGTTRRVIELQSDLFQKGRLAEEARLPSDAEFFVKRGEEPQSVLDEAIKRTAEVKQLEPYRNTWHERIIREEVKTAAVDGKTKLQFPTGETAMKIEGLGQTGPGWWTEGEGVLGHPLEVSQLKVGLEVKLGAGEPWIITDVLGDGKFKAMQKSKMPKIDYLETNGKWLAEDSGGQRKTFDSKEEATAWGIRGELEQFDISGKIDESNPIFRFYEKDVQRFLRNKYDAQLITDPQGVKWWQVDIKPEMAKSPIEAFGLTPLLFRDEGEEHVKDME